jgi:hypothetical protein
MIIFIAAAYGRGEVLPFLEQKSKDRSRQLPHQINKGYTSKTACPHPY